MTDIKSTDWAARPAAPAVTGEEGPAGWLAVTTALWVWVMKAEVRGWLAVGPARVVELT